MSRLKTLLGYTSLTLVVLFTCSSLSEANSSRANSQHQNDLSLLKRTGYVFQRVSDRAGRAIVSIRTPRPTHKSSLLYSDSTSEFMDDEPLSLVLSDPHYRHLGTGIVISPDGYIVTNHHAIKNQHSLQVVFPSGKAYKAKLIGSDVKTDMVLLKVKRRNLPFLKLGSSKNTSVGNWVISLQRAHGDHTILSKGIISSHYKTALGTHLLQSDTVSPSGHTGGALLSLTGRLIGIHTSIYGPPNGHSVYSFSLPSPFVKRIVDDIKQHGHVIRGWAGIRHQPITRALRKQWQLSTSRGAIITTVYKNSPAAKIGIKPQDIIVSFNSKRVTSSLTLHTQFENGIVGKSYPITIRRGQKNISMALTLIEKPSTPPVLEMDDELDPIGLQIDNTLHIIEIEPESVADNAGLRLGDMILEVNDKKIKTIDDYDELISTMLSLRDDPDIEFYIKRENTSLSIMLQM